VQGHGVLVAIHSESSRIEYCSANSSGPFGIEPARLLGQTAHHWLSGGWPAISSRAGREGKLGWCHFDGDTLAVAGHRQGGT
jgi:light-regulated signal transduction histidine kinase (bacteriophytochrome)